MSDAPSRDAFRASDPGSAEFRVDRYPFYLLNRLVSRYNSIIERRLRPIGLDIPTWRVLMILGERDPRGTREIADAAVINLSTTTRILRRMADHGLVSLSPSATDARVTQVRLAEAGRARLPEARAASAPIFRHLIEGVEPEAFEALILILNRLHANLGPLTGRDERARKDRPWT